MSLFKQIEDDVTQALKAGNKDDLSALRLLKNSLDVYVKSNPAASGEPSDEEVTKIVQKEIKQRRESVESYRQGGRNELADKEEREIKLYEKYLPEPLGEEELNNIVEQAISETKASSMAEMGKVMAVVNAKVAGRADGGHVASLVKSKLAS